MTHGNFHAAGVPPRSKLYQGPFGRIFRELLPWRPQGVSDDDLEEHFLAFAAAKMIEEPGKSAAQINADATLQTILDDAFDSQTPAGYTYFGQFVDHDITFDPASSLMRQNDPQGLLNHRTPRLDLDNVYGSGPDASPHLYDLDDPFKFLIGAVSDEPNLRDLPRNQQGRALIGDPRNDENAMVSQLQLAFMLAHNELVDRARSEQNLKGVEAFDRARTTLRWLYQHIVWNDFLTRLTDPDVHKCALSLEESCGDGAHWKSGLDEVYSWKHNPYMPVEFSVAAYRFGHSLVRNGYQTNHPHRGVGNPAPIFDNSGAGVPDDLRGFTEMRKANVIQWDWFLNMNSSIGDFPQLARKIDTKLSNALSELPFGPPGPVLAARNLMRGVRFDLPAGTAVAKRLGFDPISVSQDEDSLWFYILKEAETVAQPAGLSLGPVGSTIVCATFAGLLKGDPCSYFHAEPKWEPSKDLLLKNGKDNEDSPGSWELSTIIRLSGLPVSVGDFPT